jgi:hypothetical protein
MSHLLSRRAVVAFLVSLAALAWAPRAWAADENIREAKVVRAGNGKIEVVEKDGDTVILKVSESARITRNDKPASLEDIKEGDVVNIKAQQKGSSLVALSIDASAPE